MTNRILAAVDLLAPRIRDLTMAKRGALTPAATIDYDEWYVFQDKRAQAQAAGLINFDESQTAYRILGSGPAEFNRGDLAPRIVLLNLMGEIMGARSRVAD